MKQILKPNPDPNLRGLVAGLIAGTVKDVPDIFLCELTRIKQFAFWDYVGVIIYHHIPHSFLDHFLCFLMEVTFSIGLGVIYAKMVAPFLHSKYPWLMGGVYGGACWFTLTSVVTLFRITQLFTFDHLSPFLMLIFSAGYGLILAYINESMTPKNPERWPGSG